jgi:hypothetical protein
VVEAVRPLSLPVEQGQFRGDTGQSPHARLPPSEVAVSGCKRLTCRLVGMPGTQAHSGY